FSGLECSILGTFYKDQDKKTYFGADVENFYSAHHYSVIKPNAKVLEMIVNFREGNITGRPTDIEIGKVRYSSSRRFQAQDERAAIFELYNDQVTRYSVISKSGFKVMKVNFYQDILSGFELIRNHLERETADYAKSFLTINLDEPNYADLDTSEKFSAKTR